MGCFILEFDEASLYHQVVLQVTYQLDKPSDKRAFIKATAVLNTVSLTSPAPPIAPSEVLSKLRAVCAYVLSGQRIFSPL